MYKEFQNYGFSKFIEYPKLFDELSFSCATFNSSEEDILNAIAQIGDCKLTVTQDKYIFVPVASKIRQRLLQTMNFFGTPGNDFSGLRQEIRYRLIERASDEAISNMVSSPSWIAEINIQDDPQLKKLIRAMLAEGIKYYSSLANPGANAMAEKMKPDGVIKVHYGFGLGIGYRVECKDGSFVNI